MAEFQQRGEDLESNFAECKRLLEEAQGRLGDLEEGGQEEEEEEGDKEKEKEKREAELKKVQAEVRKLKKDEKAFEKMIKEYQREEKKLPWNVDTISKEGFSKVRCDSRVTEFCETLTEPICRQVFSHTNSSPPRCKCMWLLKGMGALDPLSVTCQKADFSCFPECTQHQACNTGGKGGEAQVLCGAVCEGNQTLWYASLSFSFKCAPCWELSKKK